jgi:low affinity Fe/Cu permease
MAQRDRFTRFSHGVAHAAGRPLTFTIACLAILGWAVSGPFFGYSETWQLVVNTSTTIITFLMVFILQNTQNRDGLAIQAKLDELIRASASENRFIRLEDMTEAEILALRRRCLAAAGRPAAADESGDAAACAPRAAATGR